jgi:alpha-methylacyl-CoA racemase
MGPLAGLRVVEMTGLAPGPYCAMMLADLGADVLRIDRPGATIQSNAKFDPKFEVLRRNRRAIELDLKSPDDVATLLRLLTKADAFIEGFRPGVMERLGLGPDECLAANPRLVYGRITGWGQNGPLAQAAGHDVNYIALAGVLHNIASPGGPPVIPLNLVGDFAGGGMLLAFGIMCALFETAKSGKGQVIDAAMVDGAASLMSYLYGHRAQGQLNDDQRGHSVLNGASPFYATYETSDGQYIAIGAAEPQFYAELLHRIGITDPDTLPNQHDRSRWPEVRQRFATIFASKTRAQWCEILEGTDACFAPVLNLREAAEHPHNRERATFIELDGVLQPAPAPRFSRTPADTPTLPDDSVLDPRTALDRWNA